MDAETRTCADCTVDISDTHRNAKRCLPCAAKRDAVMRKRRQERHRQANPPPKAAAVRELVDEVREMVAAVREDRQAVAALADQVAALADQVAALAVEVRELRHRVWEQGSRSPRRRMRRLAAAVQGWKSPAARPHQILPPVDDGRQDDVT